MSIKAAASLALLLVLVASARASLLITEVMTNNVTTLLAEDGSSPDWLELHNSGAAPISLEGHFLTDDPDDLSKWPLPSVELAAGDYLIIFASGDDLQDPESELHSNFRLKNGGEYLALVGSDRTTVIDAYAPEIPQLEEGQSFGVERVDDAWVTHFFATPTPGAENTNGSVAEEVVFSAVGKAFTGTMQVELSSRSGATIRYTTDGTPPGTASPSYNGPISISETTILSAAVAGGPVRQEVYFSLASDLAEFSSDLPIVIVDAPSTPVRPGRGSIAFTEMLIGVIEPVAEGERTGLLTDFSITSPGHIRVRGSSTSRFPKPSYRIEFQDENGDDRVVKPLGMPAESDWILSGRYEEDRALIRNEFVFELSHQIGRYAPRTRFVEVYLNTQASGSVSASDYIGLYSLTENLKRDADRIDIDELTPEMDAEPEVTGGYILKVDRGGANDTQITGGSQRILIVEPDADSVTTAQRNYIQGYLNDMAAAFDSSDPETGYPAFLDVGSFVDTHMLNMLMLNVDALRLSSFFHKDRNGKLQAGPIWDFNISSGSRDRFGSPPRPSEPEVWRGISGDRGTDFFGNSTQRWWGDLFDDREFQQAYCDRWNDLREGPFSTENLHAIIDAMAEEVREAQARNEERWDEVPPEYGSWQGEIDHLKDWLATRAAWVDNELVGRPKFSPAAGPLSPGTAITLTGHRGGTLYYTTDGSDPRLPGGAVSPDAVEFSNGFSLEESAILTIREHLPNYEPLPNGPDQEWSAPATVAYVVGEVAAAAENLAISEIMYHPANPTDEEATAGFLNDDDFEFLELHNRSDQTIDLFGATFDDGIRYTFAETLFLAPGDRVVLVANQDAFRSRYGDSPVVAGIYEGRLANSGDRVTLRAADSTIIQSFRYNDKDPWPTAADGDGSSLELSRSEPDADPSEGANWAASTVDGGTPGTGPGEDPLPGDPLLIDVTSPGDLVVLVNGINDGDGDAGPPPSGEMVEHVIDDAGQKYLNFLDLHSGFIVVPSEGITLVEGLRFYTANDVPARDPASFQLFGSVSGVDGTFTLIAEGELNLPDERNAGGQTMLTPESPQQSVFFENSRAYTAYQLVFPTLKDADSANSMQIAEVELLGSISPPVDVTLPGDPLIRIDGSNDGDGAAGPPPGAEMVEHVIDDVGQKYLNFLDLGSGFVVSPTAGATVVTGLRLFTANDEPSRDPASYVLEGSTGGAEGEFFLISQGDLTLPEARNEGGQTPFNTESAFQEVNFVNDIPYTHYRLTFPTLRDADSANSVQIAEVEFLGLVAPRTPSVIPGAIGYWSFDDRTTVTADLSSAGNAGTVNGGALFILGHSGQAGDAALRFDGIDDSVTTTTSLFNNLTEYTMSAWIRTDSQQEARTGLFGQNDAVEFGFKDAGTVEHWGPSSGAIEIPVPEFAEWTHVAVTSNSGQRLLFLNGERVAIGRPDVPVPANPSAFNIGGGGIFDATGNFFRGDIDEVAVWSTALGESEIEALANRSAIPGPSSDPVDPAPLSPIARIGISSDGSIVLTLPDGEAAGIEFSTDLIEWERIGESSGDYQDDDPTRRSLPNGYYRTVRD